MANYYAPQTFLRYSPMKSVMKRRGPCRPRPPLTARVPTETKDNPQLLATRHQKSRWGQEERHHLVKVVTAFQGRS